MKRIAIIVMLVGVALTAFTNKSIETCTTNPKTKCTICLADNGDLITIFCPPPKPIELAASAQTNCTTVNAPAGCKICMVYGGGTIGIPTVVCPPPPIKTFADEVSPLLIDASMLTASVAISFEECGDWEITGTRVDFATGITYNVYTRYCFYYENGYLHEYNQTKELPSIAP